MRNISKRILFVGLCVILISLMWMIPRKNAAVSEQIDEAYQYPVQLRTPEWNALSNREERLAACQVDEALLEAMTTPAIIETILNYPMLAEMYAFNSIEEGIEHVSADFYGITELVGRSDAISCLEEYAESAVQATTPPQDLTNCYIQTLTTYVTNSSKSCVR